MPSDMVTAPKKPETLAQMQARLASLEQELRVLRYRIKVKQGQISDTPSPVKVLSKYASDETAESPVLLRHLSTSDPLTAKWRLGAGLPPVAMLSADERKSSAAQVKPPPARGKLRLFGILSTGESWLCTIPMSEIEDSLGKVIGRSEDDADIILDDIGVSRCHARFALERGVLVLSDLGSTNGIQIDGEPQPAYERNIPIFDGMVLSFGSVALRVEIVD